MRAPTPVPGSVVWLRQRRWRVERTCVGQHVVRLDVARAQGRLTVLAPFDKTVPLTPDWRPVRVRRQQGRARLAHELASMWGARDIQSAIHARLDLWPHQFEPALAALGGQRRLLIADEVGLGKTIQAGLILAELQRRHTSLRALVVAPAGLCEQWRNELRFRFALDARPADRDSTLAAGRSTPFGSNVWHAYAIWIASIDYLKQPHVLDCLPVVPWDVVIIDEAHIATGPSDRHDVCHELGRRARHLILLSATPHSGDEARFARLLRLGALPAADDTLQVFCRTRADVALPHRRCVRWRHVRPSPPMRRLLDALQAYENAVLTRARIHKRDASLLLLAVFRKRALSTAAALDRTLTRRLAWLDSRLAIADWVQLRLDLGTDDDMDDDERMSLTAEVGLPEAQERAWLRRLSTLASAAGACDPKIQQLQALASRTREPLVVFTEFRHSLECVQRALARVRDTATLHGGQSASDRLRELARFLGGEASVLVATDVGGQGLNLQHRARWVINLELPWNPTRLEQRIGRVDRLGQVRDVHTTLLVMAHRFEASLLTSLARRTLRARRSLGSTTLASVVPPAHLAVASALLSSGPEPTSTPAVVPLTRTTHHRRTARALVHLVARRRALERAWRGPGHDSSRPVLTPLTAPCSADMRGVLLYAVPVLDGTGDIVERRPVAVITTLSLRTVLQSREARAAIESYVVERLQSRLTRVARFMAASVHRRLATERAVVRHLLAQKHPGDAQLGLFSQRERRAFERASVERAAAVSDARLRMRHESNRCRVECARPSLVWAGEIHEHR